MEPGRCRAPSTAGRRRETLSSSRPRGQGAVVHTGSSAVKGGDGRGLEASDDQPDAQRKLPESDRECGYQRRCGRSADEVEQNGEVCRDEQRSSDKSEQGKNPWYQARAVQQGAQQHGVQGRHEASSEEKHPVVHGDQRMTGDQRVRSGTGLPQGHERQDADDADEDGGAFHGSRSDEAHRDPFVLPLEHREQRDGGADAGKGDDDLEEGADEGASVRASAEDVIRTFHRTVDSEGRDRDKGEQVERASSKRGLSMWTHLELLLFEEVIDTMTVWRSGL